MASAIILAILNALFMSLTFWWGSKMCLDNPHNKLTSSMPLILMLPRFLLAVTSVFVGIYVFGWDTSASSWFVGILMGAWVLIMTAEVIYVQHRLSRRREKSEIEILRRRVKDLENEESEMEENQSESIQVPTCTRCSDAFIEYRARSRLRLRKV